MIQRAFVMVSAKRATDRRVQMKCVCSYATKIFGFADEGFGGA